MKGPEKSLPYPAYIPLRIAGLRKQKRIPQKQVAGWLGITQQTYSEFERGTAKLNIDELILLAKKFDVSVDFITGASNVRGEFPKY